MVRVAFYRGKGTLLDRLIRLLTRSRYSRVEVLVGRRLASGWHSYAPRAKTGIARRIFNVETVSEEWDVLELPPMFTKAGVERWYKANVEMNFSLLHEFGIPIFSGAVGSAEAAVHALDLAEVTLYTQGALYRELVDYYV